MSKKIGFLGCGKIGRAILEDVIRQGLHTPSFVQDPALDGADGIPCPVVRERDDALLAQTDLVIECAVASVLKAEAPEILKHSDLLLFSVTAFADQAFYDLVVETCKQHGTHVYLPHGAIVGVDGIADASELLHEVTVETVKPPKALGRTDTERTVLYDGSTRGACAAYPRNVNVHACLAMAGVGFDKMHSRIISDPDTTENTHHIVATGDGFRFDMTISSFSTSGVTGAYTPGSACGSVRRVIGANDVFRFV